MGNMKDSGIEWVGMIPSSWNIHPVYYYFGERKVKNYYLKEKNLLSLSYGKIIRKDINTSGGLLPANFSSYNIVEAGDIIIRPTDLQNDKRSLRTGFVTEHGIITSAYINLVPKMGVNSKYYYYLLHAYDLMKVFYNMGNGVRQGLNYGEFSKLMVVGPTENEQRKIVDYLDEKCSEIDSLAIDIQTEIDTLEEYRISIINDVLMYGISGKSKHKEVRFKYIATVKSNLVPPIFYSEYPQVAPDNIAKNTGKLLSYSTVEDSGIISGNHLFYKGQIIYSKIRPNLNKAIIAPFDGLCSADMYPIEAKIDSKYLLYAMLSRHFVGQVKIIMQDRVKMPKINQEELGNMRVYIAPDTEQKEIALYLDKKCAEIDSIIETKKEQLTVLDEYKKTIIFEYVTGKKEVI